MTNDPTEPEWQAAQGFRNPDETYCFSNAYLKIPYESVAAAKILGWHGTKHTKWIIAIELYIEREKKKTTKNRKKSKR